MSPSPRRPIRPARSGSSILERLQTNRKATIAAVIAILVAAWLLWPESYSHIENLDSRGSAIVAFGDSLTAGYGAGEGEDYPSRLASATGLSIINAGVSGDTTESALKRLEREIVDVNPRIVIVGLGGNDYLQSVPIGRTESNLRKIIRIIQNEGAIVVLLGFRFPSLQLDYEGMYERLADEEGALLIPDMLDGILGDASLKSDSVHPNAKGYALMAERVEGPLLKLARKADAAR